MYRKAKSLRVATGTFSDAENPWQVLSGQNSSSLPLFFSSMLLGKVPATCFNGSNGSSSAQATVVTKQATRATDTKHRRFRRQVIFIPHLQPHCVIGDRCKYHREGTAGGPPLRFWQRWGSDALKRSSL